MRWQGLDFSWGGGWCGVPMGIPGHAAHCRLHGCFMSPQSIETWKYLYKMCTWAYTAEINWETWCIYSNKCWLNCIFFFSRTINSFPFSDWIHKSKEHISWTTIMKLLCFIYWSPKLYLPMHFCLLCIRWELLFFFFLCYCSQNHLRLLNWQCIKQPSEQHRECEQTHC